LELDEELQSGLVWLRFQALKHLRPVILERVSPAAARLVAQTALFARPDDHSSSAGVLAPGVHTLD